jgi:Sulfotransferase domain
MTLRLAMWSGPRNISTAMMRSWGNRPDTIVCDEPLYAHYLAVTGLAHPGAAEVIAHGPVDAGEAVKSLLAPLPPGKAIFYQKHMAHHLLPGIERSWLNDVTHCFLIRDPRQVILSYAKHVADPTLEDTGFPQQAELFQLVCNQTGTIPPVVDAADILNNPRGLLSRLCEALDVGFSDAMLSWPPGPRDTDGVWAKYWYKEVEHTMCFRPPQSRNEEIPPRLADLHASCRRYYEQLYSHRLRP